MDGFCLNHSYVRVYVDGRFLLSLALTAVLRTSQQEPYSSMWLFIWCGRRGGRFCLSLSCLNHTVVKKAIAIVNHIVVNVPVQYST